MFVYKTFFGPVGFRYSFYLEYEAEALHYTLVCLCLQWSYDLAMAADEVPSVGGHETRKVSISFTHLLHQVVAYLKLPVPAYYLVDVGKNAVKIVMETDPGLGPSMYEGGPATTIRESREKAAENVVRALRMEFSIQVEDFTSRKIKRLERAEFLYQMKRIELEAIERGTGQVPVKWPAVPDHKRRKKYVCIDYMDVLHTLSFETKARISEVDTFNVGPGKFVSWVTIYGSSVATGVECFFSAVRADLKATKQDAARKAVDFIRTTYNLDMVDLNYGNRIYAGIKCSLARESYLAAKERVLGIQGALQLAPFLVEESFVTPKSAVHRIPAPTLPPPPPHKPRSRPSFSARYTGHLSPTPAELDSFFKRRKFE
ncbi:uncharacterized protein LOC110709005 isoform X2 [Chenopodium quinoa]|uniref:uncharacterized protein LOC110709005 isoform X2 n=1 Tax=Chenopodium quinoa TaxID=63459 RepID=UPI000B77EA01|nr:uncharacterized protein LOC110709005 isoform X2 [Chenopodium quinoa]XP_021742926.1 uncharacterized protein LOC110709005 isoform X2 [Chenopodium quinoa]